MTPFKGSFIDYVKCNITVKDITKYNTVIWIGTTTHKFVDANGKDVFLPFIYYHLPTTDVQIFSRQAYHQLHGAHSIIKGFNVKMVLKNHNIFITINIQEDNLTICDLIAKETTWATIEIRNSIHWFVFFEFLWRYYNRYKQQCNRGRSYDNWQVWSFLSVLWNLCWI